MTKKGNKYYQTIKARLFLHVVDEGTGRTLASINLVATGAWHKRDADNVFYAFSKLRYKIEKQLGRRVVNAAWADRFTKARLAKPKGRR